MPNISVPSATSSRYNSVQSATSSGYISVPSATPTGYICVPSATPTGCNNVPSATPTGDRRLMYALIGTFTSVLLLVAVIFLLSWIYRKCARKGTYYNYNYACKQ